MTEQQRGPADVPTSERMVTLATAKVSAIGHRLRGEQQTEHGTAYIVDPADVEAVLDEWPAGPKKAARLMLEQYGPPNQATLTLLLWHHNGPWKRTMVSRDEIVHNFPTAHTDFLTQYIDYQVPVDKFNDITAFDGSCLADRTAGEAAARCDSEAMNMLTLNLMHDIVTGAKTVDEARQVYADNAVAHTLGRTAPDTERLRVPTQPGAGDPDQSIIAPAMARQMVEKTKDVLRDDT